VKRLLYLFLAAILVSILVLAGCSKTSTTTSTPTSTPSTPTSTHISTPTSTPSSTPTSPQTTPTTLTTPTPGTTYPPAPVGNPVRGGTLRQIAANGPMCLSWLPNMGPGDEIAAMPAAERMLEYNAPDKQIHPMLAESVDVDQTAKTITFHIRHGVKFTDGSDLTADVCAFWYKTYQNVGRLQFGNKVTSIDVVDQYTMRLTMSDFTNQYLDGLGWVPIFSKQAFDVTNNGDLDTYKNWAAGNIVATGPFMLKEYKVDDHITWVKNPNYWQQGKPYLDGITVTYIPDSVTAQALMEAGQADEWFYPVPVRSQVTLTKMGFVRQEGFGTPGIIYINNKDPNSPFQDLKVREAVEYSLDKPTMAKALGLGYYTPLTMVAPPGQWGYDPTYPGRPYDPAKARQLLKDAGYPNGLKVTVLIQNTPDAQDVGTAIKSYMDAAGFDVNLDVADAGRFFSEIWITGWPDLAVFLTGLDFNYLATFFRQFGPDPFANYQSFKRPQELIDMCEQAYQAYDQASQQEWATKLVRYMADQCLVVPTWLVPAAYIIRPYVHTTYLQEMMVARAYYNEWMDPH
jgi:peptide/nickel transport system substrate-binding protein